MNWNISEVKSNNEVANLKLLGQNSERQKVSKKGIEDNTVVSKMLA